MFKHASVMRNLSNEVNKSNRRRDDIFQEIETRIYFAARTGHTSCDISVQFNTPSDSEFITEAINTLHAMGYTVDKQRVSDNSYILFIAW